MKENNKYVDLLKSFILKELDNYSVKVYLFGSRARGSFDISSDVDIGFIPSENFNADIFILLKEKIENLNIPYSVDFVNLNEVEERFKQEVLKDAIVWKDYN